MDLLLLAKAALLGAIEGLTELLPVSSGAHLTLAGAFLGITGNPLRTFALALEAGVALALLLVYSRRILGAPRRPDGLAMKKLLGQLVIALLPTVAVGACAFRAIQGYYFNGIAVAATVFACGFVMMPVDGRAHRPARVRSLGDMRPTDALWIGLLQCLGLVVPGIGRSTATIVGAMAIGLSRRVATEFSLSLAVPTLLAASACGLWQARDLLSADALPLLGIGFVASFLCAWGCLHWLMKFLASHTYAAFAWYRISFGLVVVATLIAGAVKWIDA